MQHRLNDCDTLTHDDCVCVMMRCDEESGRMEKHTEKMSLDFKP